MGFAEFFEYLKAYKDVSTVEPEQTPAATTETTTAQVTPTTTPITQNTTETQQLPFNYEPPIQQQAPVAPSPTPSQVYSRLVTTPVQEAQEQSVEEILYNMFGGGINEST